MSVSLERQSPAERLRKPVVMLEGVGPERAAQLGRLGIRTVSDLLLLRPRRYEDRRQTAAIVSVQLYSIAMVRGRIADLGVKRYAGGRKSVFEFILEDETGRLHCRWWNMPYLQHQFQRGDEVLVYGKLSAQRPRTMDHPETEVIEGGPERLIHLDRVVPIYPLTEGMSQRWLRRFVFKAVEEYATALDDPWRNVVPADFPGRQDAVRQLHFPLEVADAERARRRLALDELIAVQLSIQKRRRRVQRAGSGLVCAGDNRLIKPFLRQLGFALTKSQQEVLREIRSDLRRGLPMRRLLQGDVASGKTVVAACSALMVLESGRSVILMAPTEILAEQHYGSFRSWFDPLGIPVGLWTGTRKEPGRGSERANDAAHGREGTHAPRPAGLTVGTHALIEESFSTEDLGLVIIDEQHKFGVAQRERLVRKGWYPHVLVMTATPIPRTLALTIYGDLDISCISEMPAGRRPVKTFVRGAESLSKVWEFVRSKLAEGQQAYIVYPRVEEEGAGGIKAVTKEWKTLQKTLAPFGVGLMHGRLKWNEKETVMTAFRQKHVQVLLSTPIIEVGVDVPNATVMVIENAERFGLSQLHQLRGRIGRGKQASYCVLVTGRKDLDTAKRLRVLEETSDGFAIAEADLRLRGPGDLIGREQSGIPPLQFADWAGDLDLVETARMIAEGEGDDE